MKSPQRQLWLVSVPPSSPTLHHSSAPVLATDGQLNPIQDTGTCLPCCKWLWYYEKGLAMAEQNHSCLLSWQWCTEFPIDISSAETLHIFRYRLKTHLFRPMAHENKKIKKKNFFSYLFFNVALEALWISSAYLMKLMYLRDSFNFWFVSTWLNALVDSGGSGAPPLVPPCSKKCHKSAVLDALIIDKTQ